MLMKEEDEGIASDEAAFITGEVLTVDGGLVMQG
jgi:NAD(P)-dependent dehydrogenase (short-subunit alcohol dehydrogenase family)